MSEKITPEHLNRKAVVYVRQSTPDQVRHHRESQRRQYELADKARGMGWQQVEVIDEDQGRSGATSASRSGFSRLVASVCLREVGGVFSLEASRLARNNRDWYQLIDMCTMVGTLIIDFDGVYDPRLLNDRLLLGLKGTMSEFELGLIHQRAHEALRRLAHRGELLTCVPVGYRRSEDGRYDKDPDARVRHAVELVFEKFSELGSIRQVLLWFRQEGVPLPALIYTDRGWRVDWKLPVYNSVHHILTNPTYAGAYAYGRTCTRTTVADGHVVKVRGVRREREEWDVLIPNHHEGYISWEVYERNQRQIRDNAHMKGLMTRGAARAGRSLLAGLLRCGRCGRKLFVGYSGVGSRVLRYACRGAAVNHGTAPCISIGGLTVDRAVSREVLRVVAPAAIEASLAAVQELEGRHDERRTAMELSLRQARYEAERTRRQYDLVEPENRLVATELERRWNEALAEVGRLEGELELLPEPQHPVSEEERRQLLGLGEDLALIWNSPATDMQLKKRLVRTVIEEIVANVDKESPVAEFIIRWVGGCHSRLKVRKNRTGQHRYRTDRQVVDLVRELAQVTRDRDMASILNRLGLRSAKGHTWTEGRVRSLRHAAKIPVFSPDSAKQDRPMTLEQAANYLGISTTSVKRLIRHGVIPARQVVPHAPWIIERAVLDAEETKRAAAAIRGGRRHPLTLCPGQEKLDLTPL